MTLVINFSGGVDSTLMLAVLCEKYPDAKKVVVFADTGWEHKDAEEWCRKIVGMFGLELNGGEWRPAIFPAEGVGHKKKVFLTIEGKSRLTSSLITDKEVIMMGIGKNKSGRLLDGKKYNEYPKTHEAAYV
jgi:3'-phosphoadenosine 5'-phosphosulfate sulfotransferase (PAPS reductase)/FAD synthetase